MRAWFPLSLVLFATFFWGTTFVLVKQAIAILPVNYFLFLRFGLATALTFPLVIYRGKLKHEKLWRDGSVLGIVLFASYYFQTVGLQFTTPANAAFITGLNIVFVPIFAAIIFKFKIQRLEIAAVLLSFLGTIFLTVNFQNLSFNIGDIIILGTAVSIALHILFTEKFTHYELIELLWVQFLVMTICAAILTLVSPTPAVNWYQSSIIIFTLFVTVILATIFAFGAQLYAQQKKISASVIGVVFSMEPVFALIIDLNLGYTPTTFTFLGMILIFIAIILATLVTTRKVPVKAQE